ncbi:uncharacterized protein LOC143288940 [Babylonia areolata]|uniref:uncharacterized protein LOC143288940 n=1 Tax=Babylonia areolata TaxID=304850 RepID=UPI003FD4EADD
MVSTEKVVNSVLVVLVASLSAAECACTFPSNIQGQWDVMDATRTTVDFSVTITSTSFQGVTFWNKTLDYECYIQQGNYYVFQSELTSLFNMYDVNIFFCWYMQSYPSSTYRIYELTGKVLYSVEERAKAYLNTTSPPSVNDVCEVTFDSSLTYKQMQVPFDP